MSLFNTIKMIASTTLILSISAIGWAVELYPLGALPEPDDQTPWTPNVSTSYSLPATASLEQYCPPVLKQAGGSCVGWAVGYAMMTTLKARQYGWDPEDRRHRFSPMWVYNHINGGHDNGSNLYDAMNTVRYSTKGCAFLNSFDTRDYRMRPASDSMQYEISKCYSIDDYVYHGRDLYGIKTKISQGIPVVCRYWVYPDMDDGCSEQDPYDTIRDGEQRRGGHASCIIGYDDNKEAFLVMNSWGADWGTRGGFFWLAYSLTEDTRLGFKAYSPVDRRYDIEDYSGEHLSSFDIDVSQQIIANGMKLFKYFRVKGDEEFYGSARDIIRLQEGFRAFRGSHVQLTIDHDIPTSANQ